jgi:hypothetical protein
MQEADAGPFFCRGRPEVSTDRQRDADLDRMLRATLGRDTAADVAGCPDAGMLASSVEGCVTAEERTALETHFASCHRCQEALAILARDVSPQLAAAPVAPARRSWLWRGHLHWLIPVTAASALVIYIASKPAIAPWFPPIAPDSTQIAAVPPQTPAPALLPQARAEAGTAAEKREMREAPSQADDLRRGSPTTPAARPSGEPGQPLRMAEAAPVPPVPVPPPAKGEQAQAATEAAAGVAGNVAARTAQDARVVKPAAEPAAAVPPPPAFAPVAAPPVPPAAPQPPQAQPPAVVAPAAAPPQPPSGAAASAAATGTGGARIAAAEAAREAPAQKSTRDQALRAAPPSVVEVAAPGGRVAWRVGPAGAIWRSADGARTWYPQKSGVAATLLAVAAPSMTTCWVVGTVGTVLLTDDGERWERLPFPEPVDLVVVEARSSHDAMVTTRDGRQFTTSDRGITWTRKQ